MSEIADPPGGASEVERLRLDLDDLRFENARLKTSIAERQAEIVALSDRLATLQTRLATVDRFTAGLSLTRRLGSWRWFMRRR